tara:strand:+ start:562 stop:1350 length:789 start_codon:yes stop_codon:yes gene_type:complete
MFDQLKSIVNSHMNNSNLSDTNKINESLRILAKYRCNQIANTIMQTHGTKILGGPFKGMKFIDRVSEGCFIPKLLGIYESELHGVIKKIIDNPPDIFINVGSAEGYYSVGLKRLIPQTNCYAYDINPIAQEKVKNLAKKNGVDVLIDGEFKIEILRDFKNKNIFLMCDIEGAEADLFKEDNIHFLKNTSLCIELHYWNSLHTKEILPQLLSKTHDTDIIYQDGKQEFKVPEVVKNLEHLDILLSAWEMRQYQTPWLIASPRR